MRQLVLALVAVALAGCLAGPSPSSTGPSQGFRIADRVSPADANVTVANRTGGIALDVHGPGGESVEDARVEIDPGRTHAVTDAEGRAVLRNLTRGDYELTLTHVSYRTLTANVSVAEGEIVVAQVGLEARDLDPIWNGGDSASLLEGAYRWYQDGAFKYYDAAWTAYSHGCVQRQSDGDRTLHYRAREFASFDGDLDRVPPATDEIEVTVDWTDEDHDGDQLLLAVNRGNETDWRTVDWIDRGATLTIDVTAGMWDHPTEGSTDWRLALCLDETSSQAPLDDGWEAKVVHPDATFDVTATLVRGEAPWAEA